MADTGTSSVLRRKLTARIPVAERPSTSQYPIRALELALARAAQDRLNLDVTVSSCDARIEGLKTTMAQAQETSLTGLLVDSGSAPAGLIIIEAETLAALVGQSLTGHLGNLSHPDRKPTRIDAEIAKGLINGFLQHYAKALKGEEANFKFDCTFQRHISDPRLLRFSLPDQPYQLFDIKLDMNGGARTGSMVLAMACVLDGSQTTRPVQGDWAANLKTSVMDAEVTVKAVLTRLTLPLSDAAGLKVGDVLPFAREDLDKVHIEGPDHSILATGRLGQSRGARALRIKLGEEQPPKVVEKEGPV